LDGSGAFASGAVSVREAPHFQQVFSEGYTTAPQFRQVLSSTLVGELPSFVLVLSSGEVGGSEAVEACT
jgi:hypothetical protein